MMEYLFAAFVLACWLAFFAGIIYLIKRWSKACLWITFVLFVDYIFVTSAVKLAYWKSIDMGWIITQTS